MANNGLMSINGKDVRIPQMGTVIRGNAFASHKYAGKSALRYEIGVSSGGTSFGYKVPTLPAHQ